MTDDGGDRGDRLAGGAGVEERVAEEHERAELLTRVSRALATPMTVLGLLWLVLIVVDLTRGLSPFLEGVSYLLWGLFVLHFLVEFAIAPGKLAYLRLHGLTVLALMLPALRILSVFRAARALGALRGVRLVRVVGSVNRGMAAVGRVLGRRGIGYVSALTVMVTAAGAAGMYAFERNVPGSAMPNYGYALWWTAMTLTTMGSDYFPKSAEGRLLALLLATYGFATFGYVTASIASVFVARDADEDAGELAGARQLDALRREVASLHRKLDALSAALAGAAPRRE